MPTKDTDSINKWCIFQTRTSQKKIFNIESNLFPRVLIGFSLKLNRSFKLVNGVIWLFTRYLTSERGKGFCGLKVRVYLFVSSLDLQVSFSVQVFGFNIADSLGQASAEQKDVTWNWSVLVDFNNIANLYLLPFLVFELVSVWVKNACGCLVLDCVVLHSLIVFKGVFDHGHQHHQGQTQSVRGSTTRNGYELNRL